MMWGFADVGFARKMVAALRSDSSGLDAGGDHERGVGDERVFLSAGGGGVQFVSGGRVVVGGGFFGSGGCGERVGDERPEFFMAGARKFDGLCLCATIDDECRPNGGICLRESVQSPPQ